MLVKSKFSIKFEILLILQIKNWWRIIIWKLTVQCILKLFTTTWWHHISWWMSSLGKPWMSLELTDLWITWLYPELRLCSNSILHFTNGVTGVQRAEWFSQVYTRVYYWARNRIEYASIYLVLCHNMYTFLQHHFMGWGGIDFLLSF